VTNRINLLIVKKFRKLYFFWASRGQKWPPPPNPNRVNPTWAGLFWKSQGTGGMYLRQSRTTAN